MGGAGRQQMMSGSERGDCVMNKTRAFVISIVTVLLSGTAMAEDVTLPAPVLEWSVYILLIFAACVAIGISLYNKGKNGANGTLDSLLYDENPMVHSIGPESSVTECVKRMNELKIGAMLVMDNERLIGIFTERDAITRVLGAGLDPNDTAISSVMTSDPVCVSPSTSLEEAMSIVSSRRIRHLPVVEDGKVLGLVSSGDLTRRLLDD
jgi:CBS domain-containing protein